jgi:hypothetical protein
LWLRGLISESNTTKSRRHEGSNNQAFCFLCVFVASWFDFRK